jgi:glc operon protein GlcG
MTFSSPVPAKPVLTIAAARRAARRAIDTAQGHALKIAVAVVDDGGRLLYFERMDDVPWGSGDVALAKAVSAAAYRRDTAVFDERLGNGRMAVLSQPQAFPIQGGVALRIQGACVGAIGASGALASEDTMLCQAGAAALDSRENDND